MTKSPKEAPAPPAASDLITPDQLATRLQVSVGTIYNRIGHWGVDDGVVRLGPPVYPHQLAGVLATIARRQNSFQVKGLGGL